MLKLGISGCAGRMGQRITQLALKDKDIQITTLLESDGNPSVGQSLNGVIVTSDPSFLKGTEVFIDFTTPEATIRNLKVCELLGVKAVIGTTGMTAEQLREVEAISRQIAIVLSSNMSVGVNVLFKLVQTTAEKTKKDYSMVISETHHVHKKDSPSGTAKTMQHIAEEYSGTLVKDMQSYREGEVIGDHTIVFESEEDVITISHHAKTRDIFAKGSIVAAKFVAKKSSGLYSMQDVLGF